jgi:hypothetical protein
MPYVKTDEIAEVEITEVNEEVDNMNLNVAPNPFKGSTEVKFSLTEDSKVVLEVYSMQGMKLATLYEGDAVAGQTYTYTFTPLHNYSQQVYHVVLKTIYGTASRQIISTR